MIASSIPNRTAMNRAITAWSDRLHSAAEQDPATGKQALKALAELDVAVDSLVHGQASHSVELKHDVRQKLGALRRSFPHGASAAVRRSYQKLRNLTLDNTVERLEKGGRISMGHFTVAPSASDIANFQVVNDGYLRGGQPDQEGLDWLAQAGVKSRIDLRGGDRDNQWYPPTWSSIKTFEIDVKDFEAPSLEMVEKFISLADDPRNQPVFVHCKAGIGRTGVMTACLNIAHGMSADQALAQEAINSYDGSLRQEKFVREFEQYWKAKTASQGLLARVAS
jgi:protein tyrosine phosphatase (PTP) superfamily phosphohydrolase (DUF442 family)